MVGRRFRGRSGTGSSRRATAGIAGWSPPYGASTHEERRIVAAREARQAAVDRHRGVGWTLVTLSIAVPGSRTPAPGAGALFAWAAREVARAFPDARRLGIFVDALGPFALWHTSTWWDSAKARCVALEASRPAARLVNLDVYSPEGAPVDRGSLLLPPRRCLCCDGPARECIRLGAHAVAELAAKARELLAEVERARGAASGRAPMSGGRTPGDLP